LVPLLPLKHNKSIRAKRNLYIFLIANESLHVRNFTNLLYIYHFTPLYRCCLHYIIKMYSKYIFGFYILKECFIMQTDTHSGLDQKIIYLIKAIVPILQEHMD